MSDLMDYFLGWMLGTVLLVTARLNSYYGGPLWFTIPSLVLGLVLFVFGGMLSVIEISCS